MYIEHQTTTSKAKLSLNCLEKWQKEMVLIRFLNIFPNDNGISFYFIDFLHFIVIYEYKFHLRHRHSSLIIVPNFYTKKDNYLVHADFFTGYPF